MDLKKIIRKIFPIILLFLCFLVVNNENITAKAYDANLRNPLIPENYYKALDINDSTTEFNNELSLVINTGFVGHSYGFNNTVLRETDPNPTNETQIICFYTGQKLSYGWDKEHVWAKSHGFPNEDDQPFRDAHHLRPTLNSINSSRSNSDFGEVNALGNKSDKFGNTWTGNTFEPRDEVKGDVARMMFYMAIMYQDSPYNLLLVDEPHTTTSVGNGRFGNLQTLLKWHYNDPVSGEEYYRNNIIYRDYQKNRNPFIDYPSFVDVSFPNEFSKVEIVQEKVDTLIRLINTLPNEINLEVKIQIETIKAEYDKLNYKEKALVTNYEKLDDAIKIIYELENPEETEFPVDEKILIDFSQAQGISGKYEKDKNFTISGKEYYASGAFKSGGDFRLGMNVPGKVASKYNLDNHTVDSAVLEIKYDVSDMKTLKITNNGKYGTITKFNILHSDNQGESYSLIKSELFDETQALYLIFDEALTGRLAIVIQGTTPRVKLASMEIGIKSESFDEVNFSNHFTSTNICIDYKKMNNLLEVQNVTLNFGVHIGFSSYSQDAKYGIIYIEKKILETKSFINLYEGGSLTAFLAILKEKNPNFISEDLTKKVVKVGNEYSFKTTLELKKDYQKEYVAVGYMEYNNTVYFLNEITHSVKSVAQYYLDNNIVNKSEYIELLKQFV